MKKKMKKSKLSFSLGNLEEWKWADAIGNPIFPAVTGAGQKCIWLIEKRVRMTAFTNERWEENGKITLAVPGPTKSSAPGSSG